MRIVSHRKLKEFYRVNTHKDYDKIDCSTIDNRSMNKVTKEQYEFALARVEELLPLVGENMPADDKNAVELTVMSDIVIAYEKEHCPIGKPTVAELIE